GMVHLFLSVAIWVNSPAAFFPAFFAVSPEGTLSLLVISLLFFLISVYTLTYIKETPIPKEKIFIGFLLLFLSTMSMATLSDHIMVLWIAIEATTLASAPLIYTHHTVSALEATWKYVLICSVGIAMALLGSILLSVSLDAGKVNAAISFSGLVAVAQSLDPRWLKAGFVFILVGYGTKMGLAPMHTWLPDAHSEAPSPVSALLSGVLLNCAYLGIFKTSKIMHAAGLSDFSGPILIIFGLISIIGAATFILRQTEYKRMLAYSSIENMGIIAVGTGIGGFAAYGAIICLIHHSLIKSSLFLTSGNILLGSGTRLIEKVNGLANRAPKNFVAFFGGFIAISGFPPFGLFLGKVIILITALKAGHFIAAGIFIFSLCVIFAGLANSVMRMSFHPADPSLPKNIPEHIGLLWPQYTLLAASIILCFWMPASLQETLVQAASTIGGGF
ncbi:hydrogenase, partial [Desulfosarcina sp. OttesenSCG-928-G17]|nr:hydrogenase [Desulfosarcina sp. OttesenSCG-928-G17]